MSWSYVDWSLAPEDAVAWSWSGEAGGVWHTIYFDKGLEGQDPEWLNDYDIAPDFGFDGDPRDSLTLRPQEVTP